MVIIVKLRLVWKKIKKLTVARKKSQFKIFFVWIWVRMTTFHNIRNEYWIINWRIRQYKSTVRFSIQWISSKRKMTILCSILISHAIFSHFWIPLRYIHTRSLYWCNISYPEGVMIRKNTTSCFSLWIVVMLCNHMHIFLCSSMNQFIEAMEIFIKMTLCIHKNKLWIA